MMNKRQLFPLALGYLARYAKHFDPPKLTLSSNRSGDSLFDYDSNSVVGTLDLLMLGQYLVSVGLRFPVFTILHQAPDFQEKTFTTAISESIFRTFKDLLGVLRLHTTGPRRLLPIYTYQKLSIYTYKHMSIYPS